MWNSCELATRLASERPKDPELLEPEPTKDDDRECERIEPGGGPFEPAEGLREGREGLRERLGSGADIGPGELGAMPRVLMSSGWNRPRRTEFFIYS